MPHNDSVKDTTVRYFAPRLMAGLASVLERPLAFIHAPMGFGKTVAVREALRREKAQEIWTSALTDNTELFWRDFCRVLRVALPEEKATLEVLEALGYPSDSVKTDAVRETLSRLNFSNKSVLVFDDVHLLPEVDRERLAHLCSLMARQNCNAGGFVRMVCISRHEPGGVIAESVFKDLAAVAGPDLFALGDAEIAAYYETCGLSLTPDAAAFLRETTGGWISALYLNLLHYSQHGELASLMATHTLLSVAIFDTLPTTTQTMLLALSPLERFTVSHARAVFADAENALKDLVRRNAFIGYDAMTESYTLHALFRAFLTALFNKTPVSRQQAVHRKNASWFIGQGDVGNAIRFLHAAKDFSKALALFEKNAEHTRMTEDNKRFMQFFRDCPADLLDAHPGATLRYAMAALSARDIPAFNMQIARLKKYCTSLPKTDESVNGWRGELELLRSFTKYNDIVSMSEHHRRAGKFLDNARSAGRSRFFGLEPWTLGSPSVLYMFHRRPGALHKELAAMRDCLPHYFRLTGMHGAGAEEVMLAEAYLYAGEFDSSAIACHQAMATALEYGQVGIELCAINVFIRLLLLRREYKQAEALLHTMRQRVEEKRVFSLLHTVDLCRGLLFAYLDQPEEIPGWLRHGGGEERLYAFAGGCSYLVHGRALLLDEKYAELIGRFELLLQRGVFAQNTLFTLYANIYVAAANAALGRKAEAGFSLSAALSMGLPDKLYVPFAENVDFLPQLAALSRKKAYREGVHHIFRIASIMGKLPAQKTGAVVSTATSILTKREREFVRLALTSKTYSAIALSLDLAPGTVKRAFVSIHKKLGVNSRKQLVDLFAKK